MKMMINVRLEHESCPATVCSYVIDDLLVRAWKPIHTTDLVILSFDATPDKDIATTIKLREDATEIISRELTKHLMADMKKLDTHNGYKSDE